MIRRRAFSRARWLASASMTVAAATALVLASCAVTSEQTFRPIPQTNIPGGLGIGTSTTTTSTIPKTVPESTTTLPRPTTTSTTIATQPVSLYFLRFGKLVEVKRQLAVPVDLDQVRNQLLIGPLTTDTPSGFGLTSAIRPGQVKAVVDKGRGLAEVELTQAFLDLPSNGPLPQAIAQLVFTLTGQPNLASVRFTRDGAPERVPSPKDGSPTSDPLFRNDFQASIVPDLGATPTTSTSAPTKPIPDDRARTSPTSTTTTAPSPAPSSSIASSTATTTSG